MFHQAVPRLVGSTEIVTQEASAGAAAPWLEAAAFWEHCPWVVCWVFPLTWEFYCAKGSYFSKAHDEMYHLSGKYLNISIMYNVLSDISCISHVCFGQHFGHFSKQNVKHKGEPHWFQLETPTGHGRALGSSVLARTSCWLWEQQPQRALQRCKCALGEVGSGHCSLTSACLPWGFVATDCFRNAC